MEKKRMAGLTRNLKIIVWPVVNLAVSFRLGGDLAAVLSQSNRGHLAADLSQ